MSVVQNQTLSLESDVETTHQALDQQDGPAILVGHSYGGAVITEAGRHERVGGLVYITAFAPDRGESVNTLLAGFPQDGPRAADPPATGGASVPRPREVRRTPSPQTSTPGEAAFMADSQVPWGVDALQGVVSDPAWRSKPTWYLLATDDRMIPLPAQRTMAERTGAQLSEAPGVTRSTSPVPPSSPM